MNFNAREISTACWNSRNIVGQLNTYDYQKRCAKCRKHKPTGGGHQRVIPGRGVYFVCSDCKLLAGAQEKIARAV